MGISTKNQPADVRDIAAMAAILVDVRGFDEFAGGHAEGAVCIPLADLERRAGEIPTDRAVGLICRSGARSALAADRLRALGFDNVVDVRGGLDAWRTAGLPVSAQRGIVPLEQQVRGVAGVLVLGFTAAGLLLSHWFLAGSLFVGFMLFLSSVTGFCPMLEILKRMPWNRLANSDGKVR
jgi:rhodanese-related sulfurtransferase